MRRRIPTKVADRVRSLCRGGSTAVAAARAAGVSQHTAARIALADGCNKPVGRPRGTSARVAFIALQAAALRADMPISEVAARIGASVRQTYYYLAVARKNQFARGK